MAEQQTVKRLEKNDDLKEYLGKLCGMLSQLNAKVTFVAEGLQVPDLCEEHIFGAARILDNCAEDIDSLFGKVGDLRNKC